MLRHPLVFSLLVAAFACDDPISRGVGVVGGAYGAVVNANPRDIGLVMIGGKVLYGDRVLMERFWNRAELETLDIDGSTKALANAAAGVSVSELAGRLTPALAGVGSSLAGLTEGVPPTGPLVARAHR